MSLRGLGVFYDIERECSHFKFIKNNFKTSELLHCNHCIVMFNEAETFSPKLSLPISCHNLYILT